MTKLLCLYEQIRFVLFFVFFFKTDNNKVKDNE